MQDNDAKCILNAWIVILWMLALPSHQCCLWIHFILSWGAKDSLVSTCTYRITVFVCKITVYYHLSPHRMSVFIIPVKLKTFVTKFLFFRARSVLLLSTSKPTSFFQLLKWIRYLFLSFLVFNKILYQRSRRGAFNTYCYAPMLVLWHASFQPL